MWHSSLFLCFFFVFSSFTLNSHFRPFNLDFNPFFVQRNAIGLSWKLAAHFLSRMTILFRLDCSSAILCGPTPDSCCLHQLQRQTKQLLAFWSKKAFSLLLLAFLRVSAAFSPNCRDFRPLVAFSFIKMCKQPFSTCFPSDFLSHFSNFSFHWEKSLPLREMKAATDFLPSVKPRTSER